MPATRTARPTPPVEPPAVGVLLAAAAVCETRGIHHLAERLDALRNELGEINTDSPRKKALKNGWKNPLDKA